MDVSPRLPLRLLVKGDSSAVYVAPPTRARSDVDFSRWLEVLLPAGGQPVTVMNSAREGQRVHDAVCLWTTREHSWSPDVVVLKLGAYDCIHAFLPARLERHVHNRHEHPGRVRARYRSAVMRPVWRAAARAQRALDRPDSRVTSHRAGKAAAELVHLIGRVHEVGSPLVLVIGCIEPGVFWREWFPGAAHRMGAFNDVMRSHVEHVSLPNVRFIDVADAVGQEMMSADPELGLAPDGIHFSGEAHRRIAEHVAGHVLEWAAQQPHLQAGRDNKHATREMRG